MLTKATRSSCNILQQRLKNPKHTSESTLGASKPATPSRLTHGFVFCLRAKGKVRAWSKPRIFFLSLFGLLLPWLCVPSLTPFDYYNSLVLPVLTIPPPPLPLRLRRRLYTATLFLLPLVFKLCYKESWTGNFPPIVLGTSQTHMNVFTRAPTGEIPENLNSEICVF